MPKRTDRPTKFCELCGAPYIPRKPKEERERKYCSLKCTGLARKNKDLGTSKLVTAAWKEGKYAGSKAEEGLQNHSAKNWRLRDPKGRTHSFKNLRYFINKNIKLFEELGTLPEAKTKEKQLHLLGAGLGSLRPTRKNPKGSWHGWTAVIAWERRFWDAKDQLDRK